MFIGRKKELTNIRERINSIKQENILIYGKRRIGKSYLIKESLKESDRIIINYQCKKISYIETLNELTDIVIDTLSIKEPLQFKNFDQFFDFLFTRKEKIVFVLDEYGYLHEKYDSIDSIIQKAIDKYKYDSSLKMIISGSSIEIMNGLINSDSPLFGRFTLVINLLEQDYYDSSLFYDSYSCEDKVLMYSVFGGEPYLNSMIDTSKSAIENILNLVLEENSSGELFVQEILRGEIDKISGAYDVLQRIALNDKKHETIRNNAHIESTAALTIILNKLQKIDIIEKKTPINDENNKKKTLYSIKSNIVHFYYRYIFKNISYRNNMNSIDFYNLIIKNDLDNYYLPFIFEKISKQFLIRINKNYNNLNKFYKIGTYWFDDKDNKVNGEFDIVTLDKNGYIFYEVKYIKNKIDDSIINEKIFQLNRLNIDYYNLGFISKSGFDIKADNHYMLYTLDDIYSK